MKVVVVESPAKAKTINKYLGDDYKVIASFGHIRDLPPKDGSVRPDEDFAMDWEVDGKSTKHVKEIADAVKGAERLYLATDPDREGEAISWHVQEVLNAKKALKDIDVKRITFNEITKTAIQEALRNPRDLDKPLIEAYLARRALDYLVGFNLSPVLWRKLPGAKSAGRVQSVALRLICERESEIESFKKEEYWTVQVDFTSARDDKPFVARLTHLDGAKLDKFDLNTEALAHGAANRIGAQAFAVEEVERKRVKRNPFPPFTTSTLQQEASRKLHFGAKKTMQIAQRLYEGVDIGGETVGLITYMRTDGVQMANEAIFAVRDLIGKDFGAHYLPKSPRMYKTKAKNAQEAHEACRPTDITRTPAAMRAHLDTDQFRLYELIWKRTMASQMEAAQLDQVAVDLKADGDDIVLRANGSMIAFDGFLKLYTVTKDDSAEEDDDKMLPTMEVGDRPKRGAVTPEQHFTQPPPRYSEASLVKSLEELGIGRPSTYASIISVLQDRDYVRLESRRFIPEDRGRVVTTFLENFFPKYVQYNFTADLEGLLDAISDGKADWQAVLRDFWGDFKGAIEQTSGLKISDVIDALDAELDAHFFPPREDGSDPRLCPKCAQGRLGLRLGKFGAFLGCSNYPECNFTRQLSTAAEEGNGENGGATDHRVLGLDPVTGKEVTVRKGPYGHYVQLGEAELIEDPKKKKPTKTKPPRVSLLKSMDPATLDLDTGLKLLALPREVGLHPETGQPILAGIGRFGPYVNHDGAFKSLTAGDDVLTIGLNRAMELISQAKKKVPARELGNHPSDNKPITWQVGRFGPYVKHGKIMATIPKRIEDPEKITLEEAIELIDAKAAKAGGKAPAKKAPAKKAPAKKAAAKKKAPAKKKTAAEK